MSKKIANKACILGSRSFDRFFVVMAVSCSVFMSACSSDEPSTNPPEKKNQEYASTAASPTSQPVKASKINQLLDESSGHSQQLEDQLERLNLPFEGQLLLELNLSDTRITDEQLETLTLPDTLTRINLSRTFITDAGLAHLVTGKNIVEVILVDTRITADGLEHLRNMSNLRTVNLHDTDVPAMEQLALLKFLKRRPKD